MRCDLLWRRQLPHLSYNQIAPDSPERKRKKIPPMGKLLEKLDKVSQTSNAGIGFLGGRPSGHAPRPIGLLASVKVTDVSAVSAAVKNGVDGIIALGWKSGASLADLKTAAGDAALGVELPLEAGAGALKEAQDAGADFVLAPSALRARALLDEVEKLDVVLELDLPRDDMEVLLLRGQSLAPAQLGLLNTGLGASEIARMSVADFARMRLIDESLRFPLLISLKEAIAAEDAVTLTRLGFAGIVLASQGTAEQIGTQIQSLREALEQVPTPKGEKGDVRLGGFASGGAGQRETREE
jgi:hypothetical protein